MVRWRRDPTGPGKVIDRRGTGPSMGKIGVGGGGIAIIAFILISLLGGGGNLGDLTDLLVPAGEVDTETSLDPAADPDTDTAAFLEDVLQDNQAMWVEVFEQSDRNYRATDLVVFNGATNSECGGAQAQSGPHYCPADELVYMDLDFLAELQRRFGAAGDTAQAYILAHEVGHHVQHQLGITEQVQSDGSNEASVALELQADCFAGVWLSTLRAEGSSAAILEAGDLEEALTAAAAVGDDAIQSQTTGQVNPDSFTHGSSEQRYQWLNQGFTTGSPGECATFG